MTAEFVPGSHRHPEHNRTGAISVTHAPPGSAVLFDLRLSHRGGANRSQRKRAIMYMCVNGDSVVSMRADHVEG